MPVKTPGPLPPPRPPGRQAASHVQAAIARSVQAKTPVTPPTARQPAAHVQAALSAVQARSCGARPSVQPPVRLPGAAAQPKVPAAPASGRSAAPHVQAALGAVQAKLRAEAHPRVIQKMNVVGTEFSEVRPTQDWINKETVEYYVHRLKSGATMKELGYPEVFRGEKGTYLVEGHHRFVAGVMVGLKPSEIVKDSEESVIGLPNWKDVKEKSMAEEDLLKFRSAKGVHDAEKVKAFVKALKQWKEGDDDGDVWGAAGDLDKLEWHAIVKLKLYDSELGSLMEKKLFQDIKEAFYQEISNNW